MLALSSATKILGTGIPWRRAHTACACLCLRPLQHYRKGASTNSKYRSATVVSRGQTLEGNDLVQPLLFLAGGFGAGIGRCSLGLCPACCSCTTGGLRR